MKKTIILLLTAMIFAFVLTGCVRSDIGITLNKNGTGSVAASFGIEKTVYEQLKTMGTDIFEGKTTTEQSYDGATYVTYIETNEYGSYTETRNALLELTYNTDKLKNLADTEDGPVSDPSEYTIYTPEKEKKDDHVFASVDIERSAGIFYSVYTFRATVNPPAPDGKNNGNSDDYIVTITVTMPDKITQSKGGTVDGKTITFDLSDITAPTEIAAVSELNHYGVVLGICGGLIVVVAVLFIFIKRKK